MRAPDSLAPLFEAGNLGWTMLAGAVLLLGLAVVILARMRWIQSRPLAACVVLSVIAHALLISAVHLTRMFDSVPPPGDSGIAVRLADNVPTPHETPPVKIPEDAVKSADAAPVMPWEKLAVEPSPRPTMTPLPNVLDAAAEESDEVASQQESESVSLPEPLPPAPMEKPDPIADGEWKPLPAPASVAALAEPPVPDPEATAITSPIDQLKPTATDEAPQNTSESNPESSPIAWKHASDDSNEKAAEVTKPKVQKEKMPARYQARVAPDREQIAKQRGGSAETEAAVRRAVKWLAANQSEDGRWDASAHAAGQGQLVEGHFRGAAGVRADTGITGLALLALLGAGHTHQDGEYQEVVTRGLAYLLREQNVDGNLGGSATNFARMYCHGIASLALCESLAMTGDERLRPHAEAAVRYTLNAQHQHTGGWRYTPGDPGDTSQFGWQVMVLTSAEQAGLTVPRSAKEGMQRFLSSVSNGNYRGLASYRPGAPASRPMTAEALACRAFLYRTDDRATEEASRFLAGQLPGVGTDDLYYWYYGTIALRLSDAEAWPRWNAALTRQLLATQESGGSWTPATKWAGHGGRVYSTALSAMCLEVYYRYQQ